jgi:hypothetical protein
MEIRRMTHRVIVAGLTVISALSVIAVVVDEQEDPYLTEAFEGVKKVVFAKPSAEQQRQIRKVSENIRAAARDRRYFQVSDDTATVIGRSGIPHIAPLIRDRDPWVRALAAKALLALDRREAVSFLTGLVCDDGSFDWMDDVRGVTVGSTAASALRGLVHQTIRARVPAAQKATTAAKREALQSWFTYHTQYYDWKDHPKYGLYWYNGLALHTSISAAELPELQKKEPERFKHILMIWPDDSTSHAAFAPDGSIRLRFIFQNFGSETTWIRWDKTDKDVHCLKMIDPKGKELPLRKESIPPLGERTPLLQPAWGNGHAMGWDLDLDRAYDLSSPGVYRLFYTYRPAPAAEAKEYPKPVDLTFWDGRAYVNYYEFRIREDAEQSSRHVPK